MKKHSRQEILLKLGQADELARAGKSQVQICKALGVSVMTFHRWRKLSLRKGEVKPAPSLPAEPSTATPSTMAEMRRVLEELTIENRRLRKIVTDLLLEKMKIEEASSSLPPIDTTKLMVANST
jgi:transposase-like protein